MTDDLIERLRWWGLNDLVEAADRIEALETEAAENARIIGMSAEREMALRGEVERLTLTVRKLQGHQAALEAEVKGLRDALKDALSLCYNCGGDPHYIEEDEVTGDHLWTDCPNCKNARAALEGTSHE